MSERNKKIATVIASVLIVALAVGFTIYFVKNRTDEEPEPTSTTVSVAETTAEIKYPVDVAKLDENVNKNKVYTQEYQSLTADSFPESSSESKEAFWAGIQKNGEVEPLSLAGTSTDLASLGFNTSSVKPTELYERVDDNIGYLNNKGIQVLEDVRKVVFSEDILIYTTDLGNMASKFYNSYPSNEDGIVFASKVGISGNTACWVIERRKTVTSDADIDAQFEEIRAANGSGQKNVIEDASNSAENKVYQLCRCGNTVDKDPKKPQPTTTQPPKTTEKKTTQPPKTTEERTKKKTPSENPGNQGSGNRGGGNSTTRLASEKPTEYSSGKPTKNVSAKTETTTKQAEESKKVESTTKQAEESKKVESTTKKAEESTTKPEAKPVMGEPNTAVDKKTGETKNVNTDDVKITDSVTQPRR